MYVCMYVYFIVDSIPKFFQIFLFSFFISNAKYETCGLVHAIWVPLPKKKNFSGFCV